MDGKCQRGLNWSIWRKVLKTSSFYKIRGSRSQHGQLLSHKIYGPSIIKHPGPYESLCTDPAMGPFASKSPLEVFEKQSGASLQPH